ncbi:TPA: hypothetical protein I0H48_RS08930 [Enterococcus faecalis]|nr:hypothetical protein [Enterococcus faecalis]HBI2039256.1 hypothetical protein [Enterococcus faecalis]HBI2079829.1 hypothetical protein [Enterococcus faecalis]HBI2108663.1 hypothetical protein [Enterococcus faecalis]
MRERKKTMYLDEFKKYLEENCKAKNIFLEKAIDYQNEKNRKRPKDKRWNLIRLEHEVNTMWETTVSNLYNQISPHVPKCPLEDYWRKQWLEFIDEHNVLDYFEESVAELEFE